MFLMNKMCVQLHIKEEENLLNVVGKKREIEIEIVLEKRDIKLDVSQRIYVFKRIKNIKKLNLEF